MNSVLDYRPVCCLRTKKFILKTQIITNNFKSNKKSYQCQTRD